MGRTGRRSSRSTAPATSCPATARSPSRLAAPRAPATTWVAPAYRRSAPTRHRSSPARRTPPAASSAPSAARRTGPSGRSPPPAPTARPASRRAARRRATRRRARPPTAPRAPRRCPPRPRPPAAPARRRGPASARRRVLHSGRQAPAAMHLGRGARHGRDTLRRRDPLPALFLSRRAHGRPAAAQPPERPHSRRAGGPAPLARADAARVGRRRRARRGDGRGAPRARDRRVPPRARGDRRLPAGRDPDLGRRPVRELPGRPHPAVLHLPGRDLRHAGTRAGRLLLAGGPAERLGRAARQDLPRARPPRGGALPGPPSARGRLRHPLRLQAAAPPGTGPRLHEYAVLPRLRPAGVRLPDHPFPRELLR